MGRVCETSTRTAEHGGRFAIVANREDQDQVGVGEHDEITQSPVRQAMQSPEDTGPFPLPPPHSPTGDADVEDTESIDWSVGEPDLKMSYPP